MQKDQFCQLVNSALPLGQMPERVAFSMFKGVRSKEPFKVTNAPWTKLAAVITAPKNRKILSDKLAADLAVFAESNGSRGNDNVVAVSAICWDFDVNGSIEGITNILRRLGTAGIVYNTHSHTDANPKGRAIVPYVAPISGEEHRAIAAYFARTLGTDSQCIDPGRGFFLPSSPDAESAARAGAVVVEGLALDGKVLAAQLHATIGSPVTPAGRPARKKLNVDLEYQPDYPKPAFRDVANGCPQMRQFAETGFAGKNYGVWCSAVNVTKYTQEGEDLAHELSAKAPEYSEKATQQKLDTMHADGPPHCSTFAQNNPDGCAGCKFAGKITTPLQAAYRQIDPAPEIESQNGKWVLWLLARYFVAPIKGAVYIFPRESADVIGDGMTREAFALLHDNKRLPDGKRATDAFLRHPDRPEFDRIEFNPRGDTPTNVYNVWCGWQVVAELNNPADRCRLIVEHIRDVWCGGNSEQFDYVMNWAALFFQRPWEIPRTALVLKSDEGTGKSIIVEILLRASGRHGFTTAQKDQVLGKFNGHLAQCVLAVLEEALFAGDPQAANAIKPLITNTTIGVEAKHKPAYTAQNYLHFILLTNNDWAVPAAAGARRYAVLDVSAHRKGDRDYFGALVHEIENGGREAFMGLLMQRQISEFNPDNIPITAALKAQKYATLRVRDSVAAWWAAQLEQGGISTGGGITSEWPEEVSRTELANSYATDAGRNAMRWPDAAKRFAALLPVGFRKIDTQRGHSRFYGYRLPELADCRQQFERATGVTLDVEA